jgi:hypothetical protein
MFGVECKNQRGRLVVDYSLVSPGPGQKKRILEKPSLCRRWIDAGLVLVGHDHTVLLPSFYRESFVFIA